MDLQKLLKLGFSGKTFDARTTGRFGLGFKSVYLVTDAPLIVSRWIAVRIHGTVMPARAADATDLVAQYPGNTAATVIELPRRRDGPAPRDYTVEIRQRLGPLCVFAKAIRTISWKDDGRLIDTAWEPGKIVGIGGVEIGQLRIGIDDQAEDHVLVFRHQTEALLLRLGSNGVRPTRSDMPTVWSLAPTGEHWNTGYLINGQFRVDVGRSRLAGDGKENFERVAHFGVKLGEKLVALFNASQKDWPRVASDLGLADSSPVMFATLWQTLFDVLSRGLTADPSAEFLGHLHRHGGGLITLVTQCPALPTNLGDAPPRLVQFSESLSYAVGALAEQSLQQRVVTWPRASNILTSCVAKEVADRCRDLGLSPIGKVTLGELLRHELGADAQINAALAAQLGQSLSIDSIEDIVTDPNERRHIETELRRCRFAAEDGSWQPVANLHARKTGNDDEDLRLAFAPPQAILNCEYSNEALRFFLLARARSGFSAQPRTLAAWARAAATAAARRAVLQYLLEGDNARALAEMLREQPPAWLRTAAALTNSDLVAGLSQDDVIRLRADLSPETLTLVADTGRHPGVPPDAGRFLGEVHDWWVGNGARVSSEYTARVYPDAFNAAALRDPTSEVGRVSWFTLLALASFQTMGRTREEQHRSFLVAGLRDGWWQELATCASADPLPWLRRLEGVAEEYVEAQPFLQWYRRFFDLYILARWLNVYSHLFLSLPQRFRQTEGGLSLQRLVQPLADPALSGSGIWAPAIDRTLGYGVCFVIRELARLGIIDGLGIEPYAWQPTLRLRTMLRWLGMDALNEARADNAPQIWRFVSTQIDASRARYRGSFDLPLQLLTTTSLRQERDELAHRAQIEAGNLDDALDALEADPANSITE
jgi:hypothetical protein